MDKYKKECQQFRLQLYQNFNKRADTAMELVDALCSYPSADSLVELTLSPLFRRTHTALYKSIAETAWEDLPLAELLGPYLPRPKERSFWLIGVDVTSQPRRFGLTVEDRGFVYQPNLVGGNKPVTIGHQYSTLAFLSEKEAQVSGSWVVPLSTSESQRMRLKSRWVHSRSTECWTILICPGMLTGSFRSLTAATASPSTPSRPGRTC
jgi:hypothetical protein